MRQLGEFDQVLAAIGPRPSEVFGMHHAVDLQRGIDLIRLGRVLYHAHGTMAEGAFLALLDAAVRQRLPRFAHVAALVEIHRRRAGDDPAGVAPIDQERPDLDLVGKLGALETGAVIGRDPYAVHRAGEHCIRVGRVHHDGVRLGLAQHLLPLAAFGRPPKDAEFALLVRPADVTCNAGEDIALTCHGTLPPVFRCCTYRRLVRAGRAIGETDDARQCRQPRLQPAAWVRKCRSAEQHGLAFRLWIRMRPGRSAARDGGGPPFRTAEAAGWRAS